MDDSLIPNNSVVDDPPPFELPDAPQFREPDPEPTPGLTAEDIRRIVREEREQANGTSEYGDLVTREDMAKIVGSEVSKVRDEIQQERAMEKAATKFRNELINEIGSNLGEGGKSYLRGQLEEFDAQGLYGLTQSPKVKDTLFRAAAYEDVKAKTAKQAPRSEGTQAVTENTDSEFERSIEAMWSGGFNTVPGLTKERFREEMKRRVS